MAEPSHSEIDDFIRANDIDDRAAADLKDCPPEVQRKVLARGELSSARNPSAALLARIRDARVSGGPGGVGSGPRSSADVEDFIRGNDVDESAADSLRSSSPTVQRAVLSRGELKTARNPSSALLARIRDAKMGVGMGSTPGAGLGAIMPGPLGMPPMGGPPALPALGWYGGGLPAAAATMGGNPYPGAYGSPPPSTYGMYPNNSPSSGGPGGYGSGCYPLYPGATAGMYPGCYPPGPFGSAHGCHGGLGPGGYGSNYPMAAAGYGPPLGPSAVGGGLPADRPTAGGQQHGSQGPRPSRGRSSSGSSSSSSSRSRSRRRRHGRPRRR